MSTFWKPVFVREPQLFQSHSLARRTDDMVGHSNLTLGWQGKGPHDDDEWRGRRPKREIGVPHEDPLYIFKADDATVNPNSKPFGGPRSYDVRDKPAAVRRHEMESIPPAPPLTDRIKNSAGLWSWQQREVRLENRIIRKYSGRTSPREPVVQGAALSDAHLQHRPGTASHPEAALSPRKSLTTSSPRRQEVKQKIMEMAARFGV
jgi:hypothetical protein